MSTPDERREGRTGEPPGESGSAVPALGREATRGMLWSTLANFAARGLGFLMTILLTRLMTKQDYGRANAAITISNTIGFLIPSMTSEVIRRRERFEEAALLRLYWQLSIWLTLATAAAILAGPITRWFQAAGAAGYLRLALASNTVTALDVPSVILSRDLRFGTLGALELGGAVGQAGTALGLAVLGLGGLAVVLGQLTRIVIIRTSAAMVTGLGWLQRPRLDTGLLREMLAFSIPVYLSDLCEYGANNWDNLFVSAVFGAEALGAYAVAYTLAFTPIITVAQSTGKVLLATIARFSEDEERRREAILRALGALMLLLLPAAALLLVEGQRLAALLFSPEWSEGVGHLVVGLSLVGVGLPLQMAVVSYCQAIDRPKASMVVTSLKLALIVIALFLFGRSSTTHAAWAVSIAFLLTGLAACVTLSLTDAIPLGRILFQLLPGLVGSSVLAAVILGLQRWAPVRSNFFALVLEVAIGGMAYLTYTSLIHRRQIREIMEKLRKRA